jgi:hypothetical protein
MNEHTADPMIRQWNGKEIPVSQVAWDILVEKYSKGEAWTDEEKQKYAREYLEARMLDAVYIDNPASYKPLALTDEQIERLQGELKCYICDQSIALGEAHDHSTSDA